MRKKDWLRRVPGTITVVPRKDRIDAVHRANDRAPMVNCSVYRCDGSTLSAEIRDLFSAFYHHTFHFARMVIHEPIRFPELRPDEETAQLRLALLMFATERGAEVIAVDDTSLEVAADDLEALDLIDAADYAPERITAEKLEVLRLTAAQNDVPLGERVVAFDQGRYDSALPFALLQSAAQSGGIEWEVIVKERKRMLRAGEWK